jgi:anti-anti-sigma factor
MTPGSDRFLVRVEHADDVAHLHLAGRFDAEAVSRLDDAIALAHPRDVVLGLGGLSYIDGAAWLAVMSYEHRIRQWGRSLRLVNVFGEIRRIFEATQTEHLLARNPQRLVRQRERGRSEG